MTTDRQPPHITVTGPSRDPFGADLQMAVPLTVAEARAVLLQLPEGRCRGELASARRKIARVADEGGEAPDREVPEDLFDLWAQELWEQHQDDELQDQLTFVSVIAPAVRSLLAAGSIFTEDTVLTLLRATDDLLLPDEPTPESLALVRARAALKVAAYTYRLRTEPTP